MLALILALVAGGIAGLILPGVTYVLFRVLFTRTGRANYHVHR